MPGARSGVAEAQTTASAAPGVLDDIRAPLELAGRYLATASVLYMLAFAGGVILVIESGLVGGAAQQFDFVAFWAAAKLALAGDPIAAFDQEALRQFQALPPDAPKGNMFWFYPPALQFLFVPFGMMPYWAGWLVFNVLAMAVFAVALWPAARTVPLGRNLVIGAPIVIIVFRLGQLSLLWAGTLALALRALERGRPALAGLLIALLSLKPQLGILIPVALAAGGHWKVVIWAFVGTLVVHGLPTLFVGLEYWEAFIDRVRFATQTMQTDVARWDLMVTPYAFLRLLGVDHQGAILGQLATTALLALCVASAWKGRRTDRNLSAAILFLAIPAATPYAYYYELALCIPAAILLVHAGFGARVNERILLALATLGPASFWVHTELAPLFAPVLVLMVLRALLFSAQPPRDTAAQGSV